MDLLLEEARADLRDLQEANAVEGHLQLRVSTCATRLVVPLMAEAPHVPRAPGAAAPAPPPPPTAMPPPTATATGGVDAAPPPPADMQMTAAADARGRRASSRSFESADLVFVSYGSTSRWPTPRAACRRRSTPSTVGACSTTAIRQALAREQRRRRRSRAAGAGAVMQVAEGPTGRWWCGSSGRCPRRSASSSPSIRGRAAARFFVLLAEFDRKGRNARAAAANARRARARWRARTTMQLRAIRPPRPRRQLIQAAGHQMRTILGILPSSSARAPPPPRRARPRRRRPTRRRRRRRAPRRRRAVPAAAAEGIASAPPVAAPASTVAGAAARRRSRPPPRPTRLTCAAGGGRRRRSTCLSARRRMRRSTKSWRGCRARRGSCPPAATLCRWCARRPQHPRCSHTSCWLARSGRGGGRRADVRGGALARVGRARIVCTTPRARAADFILRRHGDRRGGAGGGGVDAHSAWRCVRASFSSATRTSCRGSSRSDRGAQLVERRSSNGCEGRHAVTCCRPSTLHWHISAFRRPTSTPARSDASVVSQPPRPWRRCLAPYVFYDVADGHAEQSSSTWFNDLEASWRWRSSSTCSAGESLSAVRSA